MTDTQKAERLAIVEQRVREKHPNAFRKRPKPKKTFDFEKAGKHFLLFLKFLLWLAGIAAIIYLFNLWQGDNIDYLLLVLCCSIWTGWIVPDNGVLVAVKGFCFLELFIRLFLR